MGAAERADGIRILRGQFHEVTCEEGYDDRTHEFRTRWQTWQEDNRAGHSLELCVRCLECVLEVEEIENAEKAIAKGHNQLGHPSGFSLRILPLKRGGLRDLQISFFVARATENKAPRRVASGTVSEPVDTPQIDGIDWIHSVTGTRARGSLMVPEGSSKTAVVHQTAADGRWGTGNTNA